MALQLANSAEKALGDFFQQSNALEKLGRLYSDTLEGVERSVDTARPVDYTHSVLDLAVQKIVEDLSWRLLTEPDATPESVGVPQLVDLCVDGVVGDYLINSAPYKVLEDLMEGQTISTCEKLWEVLETRKQKLTSKHFIAEGPGRTTKASLCLLRMCNALLRRLSKTHNSVFCGKILLFLSFTFSLSERSAVNLTGKVNASNVTAFENQDAFEAAEAADIDKDASSGAGLEIDKSAASESGPIDYNLYRTFWGVQRFLRERELSTEDSEKFFQELNVVLAAFEGNAFSPDDLERTRDLMGSTASSGGPGADASDHYFQPKYLTNSRLFRLQLRDPILRETVLTQFLIQFNNLSNSGPARNNSALASKIQQLEKRVMVLLKQTPSDGEGFSEMVTSVLEREANWKKWKLDKCPPYEKFPSTEEDSKDSVTVPKLKRKPHAPLLTQILSESSQPSHILNRIKGDSRATAVPLATYMEKFTEAWDPENGIEEEYWPDKDEMHCWRTMRAAMRTSVNHLDLSLGGAGALVKGILGINDSKAAEKKDAPTEPPATSENDSAVEAGSEAAKKSSSETPTKRERSDSGRSVHSSEPPSKRERTRE